MVKTHVDFLIIGQGIAGTHLAAMLMAEGLSILVVDNGNPNAASRVNLGLMNPITGRKLKLAWKVEQVFPFAEQWYHALEQQLQHSLFFPKNLIRFFVDEKQSRLWEEKKDLPEYRRYIAEPQNWHAYQPYIHAPFGAVEITGAALVNVNSVLDAVRRRLRETGAFLETNFSPEDITLTHDGVIWKTIFAKAVIFCEGFRGVSNPFFSWIPFSPVKGEAIDVEIPELPAEKILHRGIFIRPLSEQRFRVGSTHLHRDYVEIPTPAGIEQLQTKLKDFIRKPFHLLGTLAGIRPATRDARPVLGRHPEHPQLVIFNGLGSKGVSMSPYCARMLTDHLLRNQPIDPELDVRRFWQK